ncbi:hypothetical protein [Ruegeria sp.]|uniref:hypothetical protein n=1 Tax=Ruegeria sp. TaxID=1879320 RepID=UPI003B58E309
MLGLEIFVHSVKMVLRNLKQAIQVSLVPALIGGVLITGLFFLFDIPLDALDNAEAGLPEDVSAGAALGFLLGLLAVLFGTVFWIVVSWHRFVLLEEYPTGFVPPFRFDRILAYFGRVLLLGLLCGIAFVPCTFVVGAVSVASVPVSVALMVVLFILIIVLFYRLSPILPAAAIGKPLSFSEAWSATSGASGAILLLIIVTSLFQLLMQFVGGLLLFIPVIGPLVLIFVAMLVLPLINVSILTTMYGVFVEKRELS